MSNLPAPDADAAAHSARLVDTIAARIAQAGGWIPFSEFMALALYAPGLGYYAAGARKFGDAASGGDFVTAPELSPRFAQALAVQVEQIAVASAPRIVEFGAGSGVLARGLLETLAARAVRVDEYAIVEVSPDLRQRQQQALAGWPVRWLDALPASIEGAVIANEVLDVMPVELFAIGARGEVLQRGVAAASANAMAASGGAAARGGFAAPAFVFADRPAPPALVAAVDTLRRDLAAAGIDDPLPPGYVSELCPAATAWTRALAERLTRGAALLIDYGFPRAEYYHPQRLMGTIMCHYRHHALADPFFLPGLTDITAHVDFTAIAQAAHDAGLEVLGYTSQAHLLLNCGLLDLLGTTPARADAAAAQRLVSEAEMGELFKVLAVGRGVAGPLRGFVRGDRTHTL